MKLSTIQIIANAHSIEGLKRIKKERNQTLMLINNIIFIDNDRFAASTIVDGTVNIWKIN